MLILESWCRRFVGKLLLRPTVRQVVGGGIGHCEHNVGWADGLRDFLDSLGIDDPPVSGSRLYVARWVLAGHSQEFVSAGRHLDGLVFRVGRRHRHD